MFYPEVVDIILKLLLELFLRVNGQPSLLLDILREPVYDTLDVIRRLIVFLKYPGFVVDDLSLS